ncbi:hypothetical protein L9F63_022994, partial [Diploptera punctata]
VAHLGLPVSCFHSIHDSITRQNGINNINKALDHKMQTLASTVSEVLFQWIGLS